MEVFMDDFLVFGESFRKCLDNPEMVLTRAKRVTWFQIRRIVISWLRKELF